MSPQFPSAPIGRHNPGGAPTLAEVAALAGVSLKTASRAINGEPHVTDDTRNKVLVAAATLGFQLNSMASLLKRGIPSNFIGLVTGDLANPFYSALAKGVEREIRPRNLRLTVASTDENPARERELIDELVSRQIRALIVVSSMQSHLALAAVQERGVPIVFADRAPTDLTADSVVLDNEAGVVAAIEHLRSLGHERIGYIGDYSSLPTERARLDAFRRAMEPSVPSTDRFIRENAHDAPAARSAALDLLSLSDAPTALFTGNNRATVGVLTALREWEAQHAQPEGGRRVAPALIGFDDFELADVLGVTVVAHDPVAMGEVAARVALDALGTRMPPRGEVVTMPVWLLHRGSGEARPGESWRR